MLKNWCMYLSVCKYLLGIFNKNIEIFCKDIENLRTSIGFSKVFLLIFYVKFSLRFAYYCSYEITNCLISSAVHLCKYLENKLLIKMWYVKNLIKKLNPVHTFFFFFFLLLYLLAPYNVGECVNSYHASVLFFMTEKYIYIFF